IGGASLFREVPRRIEVRAAMLGRAQGVGRVEPATRGWTVGVPGERELRGRRRPVERARTIAVRQVDEPVARELAGLTGDAGNGRDGEGQDEAAGGFHRCTGRYYSAGRGFTAFRSVRVTRPVS